MSHFGKRVPFGFTNNFFDTRNGFHQFGHPRYGAHGIDQAGKPNHTRLRNVDMQLLGVNVVFQECRFHPL